MSTILEAADQGNRNRLSEREKRRLRNAVARRKLERMREDKTLQRWLTDVWNEPWRER